MPDLPQAPAGQEFREFLRNRAGTITSRAKEAGFFRHLPTRGVAREDVLLQPLGEILPGRFSLFSGEVRAFDGVVSNQWDILISDARHTPKLFEQGGSAVLPIETVRAVISVKSRLDAESIREAVSATALLRSMQRRAIAVDGMMWQTSEPSPASFVFGFLGTTLAKLRGHLIEAAQANPAGMLNGICLHTGGMVVPVDQQGATPTLSGERGYAVVETGDGSYGVFVAMLYAALQAQPMHAPDLVSYIDLGRISGHIPE